jgi:hypothetical protein
MLSAQFLGGASGNNGEDETKDLAVLEWHASEQSNVLLLTGAPCCSDVFLHFDTHQISFKLLLMGTGEY